MNNILAHIMNRVASMTLVAVVVVAAAVPARAQDYSDAPPVLKKLVEDAASDIVADDDHTLVGTIWPQVVFYAVADGLTVNQKEGGVRNISPYKYFVETARTDKQIGASSGSSGSTSALEKPGISSLIGMAIEHGAIDQEVSGSGVTLSTSPYALFRTLTPETHENFRDYGFWRRIGASVTFSLDDQQAPPTDSLDDQQAPPTAMGPTPVESFDTKQISEWSLRFQVLGDRSARSSKADSLWVKDIQPLIQKRLDTLVKGMRDVLNADSLLRSRKDALQSKLIRSIRGYLNESAEVDTVERKQTIVNMILLEAEKGIFEPVRDGGIEVDKEVTDLVVDEYVPTLLATHEQLQALMQRGVGAMAEQVNKAPVLTLGYTNHLPDIGSDISDLKLLFEGFIDPVNVVFNAGLGLYHSPDTSMNQSTVRDFTLGLSLEAEFNNFFASNVAGDFSKITFSFTARYRRMEEADDEIWVAQAKLNIPIRNGLSLPLSVTYANRTELIDESEVRGNFGITFDLDKLFALAQGPPSL